MSLRLRKSVIECEEHLHQEVKGKRRTQQDCYKCTLCRISFSREQNLKEHLGGKKHKRKNLKEERKSSAKVLKIKPKRSKKGKKLSPSQEELIRASKNMKKKHRAKVAEEKQNGRKKKKLLDSGVQDGKISETKKKKGFQTKLVEQKQNERQKRKLPDSQVQKLKASKKMKIKRLRKKKTSQARSKRRESGPKIVFPEKPVPHHVFLMLKKEVVRFLRRSGFGPLTKGQMKYLMSFAKKTPCTVSQITSSFRCAEELFSLYNHHKIEPTLEEVKRATVDFIALSRKIFMPPIHIIRQYLKIKLNMSKNNRRKLLQLIKTVDNFESLPEKIDNLSKHEFLQIKHGIQQDNFTSSEAEARNLRLSLQFENNLAEHFKTKNLQFLREGDIRKKRGKGPTPDFLFEEEVSINGVRSFWVDAKNFMASKGLGKKKIRELRAQAIKYIKTFGSGAFVFSDSFVSDFHDLDMPQLSLRNGQDFAPTKTFND